MEQKKVKHFLLTNEGYEILNKLCDVSLKAEGMSAMPMVLELLQKHLKAEFEEENKE